MSRTPTIVLVHGLAIVQRADRMLQGVAEALVAGGHRVAPRPIVQGDGSLAELSERLWAQLAGIEGPLALLCHSLGGLEARTFLLDDARARRLAAIVTIASPHRGTPLAMPMQTFNRAYRDLTRAARDRWTALHGAAEAQSAARHGIRCLSVVARVQGLARAPQLYASQALVGAFEGPNDGLVSVASQRWASTALEVDLDHVESSAMVPSLPRHPRALETWCRMAELAVGER